MKEGQRFRPWAIALGLGLPVVGLALLALVLSDEAKWAQLLAAAAMIGFLGLCMWARKRGDEEAVKRGELPAWVVGRWRYVIVAGGVVLGVVISNLSER